MRERSGGSFGGDVAMCGGRRAEINKRFKMACWGRSWSLHFLAARTGSYFEKCERPWAIAGFAVFSSRERIARWSSQSL